MWLLGGLAWLVLAVVVGPLIGKAIRLAVRRSTARFRAVGDTPACHPHG